MNKKELKIIQDRIIEKSKNHQNIGGFTQITNNNQQIYIYEGDFISKPRMTRRDKWLKRDVTSKYWAFKDKIKLWAKKNHFKIPEEPFKIIFYIKMPDSWTNKKIEAFENKPHRSKPDIDNLCKSIFDCLCEDGDQFIYNVHLVKYWSKSPKIVFEL